MNIPSEIDDFEPDLPTDCYSAEEIEELIAENISPRRLYHNSGKLPPFIKRRNSLTITASKRNK